MLAMPFTLAPVRLDAGRPEFTSRLTQQPCGCGYVVGGLLNGSLPKPLDLLGYCRWDGRSGHVTTPDNHRSDLQVAPIRKIHRRESGSAASEAAHGTRAWWPRFPLAH